MFYQAEIAVGLLVLALISSAHIAAAWMPALAPSAVALNVIAVSVWAEGWMAARAVVAADGHPAPRPRR